MAKVTAGGSAQSGPAAQGGPSRRERQRRELLGEIGQATRHLVVSDGPPGVTMAAVADRVGVTAPALYRYVDGRTGLLELGCVAVVQELVQHLRSVQGKLEPEPLAQVLGLFRELRRWSLVHPQEFGLVFAHPATAYERAGDTDLTALDWDSAETSAEYAVLAVLDLEWVFELALIRLWVERQFPVPDDATLSPELRSSIEGFTAKVTERARRAGFEFEPAPAGACAVLLDYWCRVYGMISMEVFGHLSYALTDGGPLFDYVLDELSRVVTGRASSS